jgi:hypothetical protein
MTRRGGETVTPYERAVADVPRPIESARDAWETGARSLSEGLAQVQEFWNSVARSWGESLGLWIGQPPWAQRREGAEAVRELHEAAVAAFQAWLRLPLALASPTLALEYQRALLRLLAANARLYVPAPPLDARR